jgi:hypothetical protein
MESLCGKYQHPGSPLSTEKVGLELWKIHLYNYLPVNDDSMLIYSIIFWVTQKGS